MNFSTAVVSSSRKKAQTKVNRYDLIKVNNEAPKIIDAGGGGGPQGLTLDVMSDTQLNQYKRTLTSTILEDENIKQEGRQTKLVTEYTTITVNVRREDFPSITADVSVRYTTEALQAAWGQFVNDLRVALNVEFVYSVLDRKDMAPVNRILGLRDGGQYFVRQREESAILEVIESGKNPEQTSWKVTESINMAKEKLCDSGVAQGKMDVKIDEILNRPTLRDAQRETTFRLLEAEESSEIIDAMWDILNAEDLPPDEYAAAMTLKMKQEAAQKAQADARTARLAHLVATGGNAKEILKLSQSGNIQAAVGTFEQISTKTHDKEVDIVGLYRLAFECLGRLLVKDPSKGKDIAVNSFKFIQDTMVKYREEVDICVLGSKLLSDLSLFLVQYRDDFYDVMLDNIQHYAPANDDFRPPRVIRRKFTDLEKKADEEQWAAQLAADLSGKTEFKDQSKLDVDVKEVGLAADELVFDLEAYIKEQEEKKKREEEEEEERRAERARLRLLAMQEAEGEEETVDAGAKKKVKKLWRGQKGYVGKPKEEEKEHKSMFDDYEDESKPKKRVLKGFKKRELVRELPVVPGIKFRGLVGPYKNDMAMLQCFATLYKFVCASYGNRDSAFTSHMPEEVACIGLVCLGQTRIMEYTMWIIDTIYMDGFSLEGEDDDDNSVAPSLALTKESWEIEAEVEAKASAKIQRANAADEIANHVKAANKANKTKSMSMSKSGSRASATEAKNSGDLGSKDIGSKDIGSKDIGSKSGDKSVASVMKDFYDPDDPLVGMDIDCASTISMQSIDVDGINDRLEEKLDPNLGDPTKEYENVFPGASQVADTDSTNISNDQALDPEDKERGNRYRDKTVRINIGLQEEIGEELYSQRYLARPRDAIVLFCAMAAYHSDLQERERMMGQKWIGLWDDASARYRRLIVIGSGLSGLT